MYNCNCMCPIKSTSAVLDESNNLVVTFPDTTNPLQNCDTLSLVICQTLPTTNPTDNVIFSINSTNFEVKTKYGNNLKQDQLIARKKYCVGVGTETPTMAILNPIPVSSFVFPSI